MCELQWSILNHWLDFRGILFFQTPLIYNEYFTHLFRFVFVSLSYQKINFILITIFIPCEDDKICNVDVL